MINPIYLSIKNQYTFVALVDYNQSFFKRTLIHLWFCYVIRKHDRFTIYFHFFEKNLKEICLIDSQKFVALKN